MDKDLVIEAYQFYIESLKKQRNDLEERIVRSNVPTVLCKNVMIYTTRTSSSCINQNIFIFNKETDITATSHKSSSSLTTEMPWEKYTFETEVPVSRVSINRPLCIDMTDAYIKMTDSNNTTTYQSNRITADMGSRSVYTFDIQSRDATIV